MLKPKRVWRNYMRDFCRNYILEVVQEVYILSQFYHHRILDVSLLIREGIDFFYHIYFWQMLFYIRLLVLHLYQGFLQYNELHHHQK